jgi:hypothetical protein
LSQLVLEEPGGLPCLPQVASELALLPFQLADVFGQLVGRGVIHGVFLQNGKGRTGRGAPIRPEVAMFSAGHVDEIWIL